MKYIVLLLILSCSNTSSFRVPQNNTNIDKSNSRFQYFQDNYLSDLELSIDEKIIKLHEIEQYTVRGMPDQMEFRQYFSKAFDKLVQGSQEVLKGVIKDEVFNFNNHGQITNDILPHQILPQSFHEKIDNKKYSQEILKLIDQKRFITNFKNIHANTCTTYKHLYLYSFWKLLKLAPSFNYQSFYDLIEQTEDSDKEKFYFIKDIKRAVWALRYLKVLNSQKIVKQCFVNSISIIDEFEKRYDFIFNFKPVKRRPLGFAVGMCGRPMNSHYLDDFVQSKSRKKPSNWDFESYKKIKEFIKPSSQ